MAYFKGMLKMSSLKLGPFLDVVSEPLCVHDSVMTAGASDLVKDTNMEQGSRLKSNVFGYEAHSKEPQYHIPTTT